MRVVVKVGTSTITYPNGRLNLKRIEELAWVLTDDGVLTISGTGAIENNAFFYGDAMIDIISIDIKLTGESNLSCACIRLLWIDFNFNLFWCNISHIYIFSI